MKRLKLVLAVLVLGASVYLVRKPILTSAAQYLVETDPPKKADLIIVLGGDSNGSRAIKACQLLQQGWADRVWLSGLPSIYGRTEGSLAIDFLQVRGCAVDKMTALNIVVDSTRDEAILIGRMMHEQSIKSYLLVTSNYHTRRSGRVFRSASPDLEGVVVAAEDDEFPVDHWWENRHARKIFLYEWMKTAGYWVGM